MKVVRVPVEKLRPIVNVRRDVGDLSKLIESIKRDGLIEPLIVSESEDGFYEVVLGYRRYLASISAGLREVPAISIGRVSVYEALEIIWKDEVLRKSFTSDERCMMVAALAEEYGVRETARRLNIPVSTVESMVKAGRTFAGVWSTVRSSRTSKDGGINFKVKVKLAEKVCEAVSRAGYKGRVFKEVAGRLYLDLVNLPTDTALEVLKEWSSNPNIESISKLVDRVEESKSRKPKFKIPNIDERVPIETGEGEALEKLLAEYSGDMDVDYKIVGEASLKIAELQDKYSGISGLICPRCGSIMRCRVCGSLVVDLCGYPHASVRDRKYHYVRAGGRV